MSEIRTATSQHSRGPRRIPPWWPRNSLRRIRPVLLLVLSLGTAGVGALQAYRAQESHKAMAEMLVRDYAVFASWSFNKRAAEQIDRAIRGSLYPLRTALLYAKTPEGCLEEVLAAARANGFCQCEEPIGGSFSFYVPLAPAVGPARFAGTPPNGAERRSLVAALLAHSRVHYRPEWGHALLRVQHPGGEDRMLAYVRLDDPSGASVLYGVELDPALLAKRFERAYHDSGLLPSSLTRGASNRELLALSVHSPSGRVLFSSHTGADTRPTGENIELALGGGSVRATVLPAVVDRLIIGGLPANRLPWLLVVFALSAALAVAAVSQLRKENRLARLRSDFVASVSHDLRTPLAVQRIFLDMLKMGRARTRAQEQLSLLSIDRENVRLTHLVENVLAFSRADQQQIRIAPAAEDLTRIVRDAAHSFAPLCDSAGARITLNLEDDVAADVDSFAIHQVVTNLLENAAKYGPERGTIVVSLWLEGDQARLTVDDQGPGIAPGERTSVFEPFRRGERHVGSATVGSGIGLGVVREIVQLHGGTIAIEDAPGGGARLHVRLPRARRDRKSPEGIPGREFECASSGGETGVGHRIGIGRG